VAYHIDFISLLWNTLIGYFYDTDYFKVPQIVKQRD